MKILITNNDGQIRGAHASSNQYALHLIINTKERWINPDRISSPSSFLVFEYSDSMVTFAAETEEENNMLLRPRFQLQEKDQLIVLLPDIKFIS